MSVVTTSAFPALEASASGSDAGRISAIDGLRGWAVFLVFLVHFFGSFEGIVRHVNIDLVDDARALHPTDLLFYWLSYSHHGVQIFFCISGFVIARSFVRQQPFKGPRSFLVRRLLRIYPAFLVSLAVAVLVRLYYSGASSVKADALIANLFFLNGLFALHVDPYNYVTWSLFFEFIFYIVFALAWRAASRSERHAPAIAVLLWLAFILSLATFSYGDWILLLPFFFGALAGIQPAPTLERLAAKLEIWPLLAAYVTVTSLACLFLRIPRLGPAGLEWPGAWPFYAVAFSVVTTLIIVKSGSRANGLNRLLCSRGFQALGRVSYSFFLIHGIIIELVFRATIGGLGSSFWRAALLGAGTMLASFAAAAVLYAVAEWPYYQHVANRGR
jgi:exopolysaccharide production protein ExoZ